MEFPPGEGAWIEVDSPEDMLMLANSLLLDTAAREALGMRAHEYYERHLNNERIRANLAVVFTSLAKHSTRQGLSDAHDSD